MLINTLFILSDTVSARYSFDNVFLYGMAFSIISLSNFTIRISVEENL